MRYLCLALLLLTAHVAALELDDSLSPRQFVDLDVNWKYNYRLDELDNNQLNALVARIDGYELRLNTAAHVGSQARIFIRLPINIRGLSDPSALHLSWTTSGSFSDGTVVPGMRTLLYEGEISEAVMFDILDFTLDIDGRAFSAPMTFEPEYEIEITSP